jgi:alkaline phosphatase
LRRSFAGKSLEKGHLRMKKFLPALLLLIVAAGLAYVKYYPKSSLRLVPTEKIDFPSVAPGETVAYPRIPDNNVRNVILFIGDGMGISQLTAARIATFGPNGRFHLEHMPVTGLLVTHNANDLITKSDAAATALATGFKTKNNMISVSSDSAKLLTILEAARERGLSTGLVTTTMITDATPAAFAAHVTARNDQANIAAQLLENRVDVLLGGGKAFFIPKSEPGSRRPDELNLIEKAKAEGYMFVETRKALEEAKGDKILGLFRPDKFYGDPPEPSLPEMAAKAIEVLSQNEKRFFLMVEQEGIDEGSHDNRINTMIKALQLFDEAVKVGLDFALQDQHTLVIVTADHETGGLNIDRGTLDEREMQVVWNSTHHTGQAVPLFAFGPHALRFTGLKDNTEIPKLFAELLGTKGFPRKFGE